MNRNNVEYVEIWPADPEEAIRESCRVWCLAEPVEFRAVKRAGWDNLGLLAILADGTLYMMEHAPISETRGPIVGRRRTDAELSFMRRYGLIPAAALGARGGKSTSEAKRAAARANGKKGGRPRKGGAD